MTEFDPAAYIGRTTAEAVVTIERATVSAFAASVLDDRPVYRNRDAALAAGFADVPAPPTFFFSAAPNWGRWEEEQPPDPTEASNPMYEIMGALMSKGGMVLHGEQSFVYHRPAVVGEKLRMHGEVKDLYTKQSGDRAMTFLVIETTYVDDTGAPVVTSTMNLIHRA